MSTLDLAALTALHEFYRNVSALLDNRNPLVGDATHIAQAIAQTMHDYERATNRPLTDTVWDS